MAKDDSERITIKIDNHMLDWIEKLKKEREFASRSDGVRKCLFIAKRVYEKGTDKEIAKFIHGRENSD